MHAVQLSHSGIAVHVTTVLQLIARREITEIIAAYFEVELFMRL